MKDKIFSLNMDKNLEKVKIHKYIFLNKDEIRVENQNGKLLENYFWKEIGKITVLELFFLIFFPSYFKLSYFYFQLQSQL